MAVVFAALLTVCPGCGGKSSTATDRDPANTKDVSSIFSIPAASDWQWTNSRLPTNTLNAAWGSSADDVWAVGEVGTILHFDGTQWS
ncbi:MAG TPA: hypothetical protein VKP30_27425, partial [Polyangiaceae bacterium]|nr:hypothetical protein [Polyangiaceae bacterium]